MTINILHADRIQMYFVNKNCFLDEQVISEPFLNKEKFENFCKEKEITKSKMFVIYFYKILEHIELMGWNALLGIAHNKDKPEESVKYLLEKVRYFRELLIDFKNNEAEQFDYFDKLISKMDIDISLNRHVKSKKVLRKIMKKSNKKEFNKLDEFWYSNYMSPIKRDIAKYILRNQYIEIEIIKKEFPEYYVLASIKNF